MVAARMVTAIGPADGLRFRLPSFQAKVARTEALIAEALTVMRRPYVAFSGGKDSYVVLLLVARVLHPRSATAIWTDDELEYAETLAYIQETCVALGVRLIVKTGTQQHGGWFRPWVDRPFWRALMPGTVVTTESVRDLAPRWGFDGVVLGLRRQEATRRRVYLRARGSLHQGVDGQWRCNPLAGWTTDDVWALIAGLRPLYHPAYDRLTAIGVPRAEQRVGPLPLTPGWMLRVGWPGAYQRLVERYGERW